MRMAGKNSADIELLNKENRVVYLRHVEGKTLETIAQELGYANASGVQKAYKRAIKRIEHPDREDYLKAHIDRLDALIETFTLPAINGNAKAVDILLDTMRQQADLLGLKSPIRIEQEVIHHGSRSLDDEVTELARVIDYIEGVAANITSLPGGEKEGKPIEVAPISAQGTTTP